MQADFWVNQHPSGEFGCRLLNHWKVQDAPLSRTFFQGQNCTAFTVFGTGIGLKTISLPVNIFGTSPMDTTEKCSNLTAALLHGIVELQLPDGFLYRAALSSSGITQALTQDGCILSCEYILTGMRCKQLQTIVANGLIFIQGNHPQMDCRITVTVGQSSEQYTMAGITWSHVQSGDKLVIDGFSKQLLKNGKNAILSNNAFEWVKLHPNENLLQAPDPLTIEYYPTYL